VSTVRLRSRHRLQRSCSTGMLTTAVLRAAAQSAPHGRCMQLREKKDEAATRERFWDVTQSKIGQLTGTTEQEQEAAASHAAEADRLNVKFGGTVVNDEGTGLRSGHMRSGYSTRMRGDAAPACMQIRRWTRAATPTWGRI
jgi:hypothetical protein